MPESAGAPSSRARQPSPSDGARPDDGLMFGAVPEAPGAARRVFGERLPLAEKYARLLAGAGVERGLIGPRETARLWDRHLLNCAVLAELVPDGASVVDIGSGAGLPGIVLAVVRGDLRMTLLEPLERRCRFLSECVSELGLERVEVRRGRAEEFSGKLAADVVVARAVAPMNRLTGLALPLLRSGGQLLAMKGERASAELEAAGPVLRRLGVKYSEIVRAGQDKVEPPATVVRVIAPAGTGDAGPKKLRKRRRPRS